MADISQAGVDFLKTWETFRSKLYNDGYGFWTIGYGHKVTRGEVLPDELTEQQGEDLLRKDLAPAITAVNHNLLVELEQNKLDALYSFEFNTGSFGSSTLCRTINEKAPDDSIRNQFMRWINAGGKFSQGLKNRRMAECNVYFNNDYKRE